MILYLFILSSSILPLVYCGDVSLSTPKNNSNNLTHLDSDGSKLVLHSEGGILQASSDLSLPKDKQLTSLLALDKELSKPKETSVKPRKGVGKYTNTNNAVPNTLNTEPQNNEVSLKTGNEKNESLVITPKVIGNISENLAIAKPINSTEAPKKPLILSYEALVNADKSIQNEIKIPATNPSSKSLPNVAKSQIPSPNEDSVVKVYPSKANSHPGMIMPIVITILVVPMFAIVGYMALRRGQEAWKNRHYKRMDFLLDGMYND